jgi:CBS domain containing-hemolysin-like protein
VALLAKKGRASGRLLGEMKKNINRPLAAILTLNTIAHTVGAAGVGAQAFALWDQKWVAVTSAVLTILILVFSEIIPKTLGAAYASRLAGFTAYTVQGMIFLTYPLVIVFQALSRFLSRGKTQDRLTREEIDLIVEIGRTEGALQEKETRVIRNLLRLNTITVDEVMTPRTVVFMLQKDLTVKQVVEQFVPLRFARIPIYTSNADDVGGIVHRHQIHQLLSDDQGDAKLTDISKPIRNVPETASIRQVLDDFVRMREHIFQVVDEYGGMAGIITLEDAIETLLDVEIVDETDPVEDMRELGSRILERKLRRQR